MSLMAMKHFKFLISSFAHWISNITGTEITYLPKEAFRDMASLKLLYVPNEKAIFCHGLWTGSFPGVLGEEKIGEWREPRTFKKNVTKEPDHMWLWSRDIFILFYLTFVFYQRHEKPDFSTWNLVNSTTKSRSFLLVCAKRKPFQSVAGPQKVWSSK